VDASAWLASTNGRDQYYEIARSLLVDCIEEHVRLVTTNWTAYEALSMAKSRGGWELASDLWTILTNPSAVELVDVTNGIERRALELFFGYRDKTWGVVDCANLIVMEDLGCRQALGFDRHFQEASRQRGFELLPSDA
jgi:predicted nucleic acid-binding protein